MKMAISHLNFRLKKIQIKPNMICTVTSINLYTHEIGMKIMIMAFSIEVS